MPPALSLLGLLHFATLHSVQLGSLHPLGVDGESGSAFGWEALVAQLGHRLLDACLQRLKASLLLRSQVVDLKLIGSAILTYSKRVSRRLIKALQG